MKAYSYYPGCSDEATGIAYGISMRAIGDALGMQLDELEDWNCCGTTPYHVAEELEAELAKRNNAVEDLREDVTKLMAEFRAWKADKDVS